MVAACHDGAHALDDYMEHCFTTQDSLGQEKGEKCQEIEAISPLLGLNHTLLSRTCRRCPRRHVGGFALRSLVFATSISCLKTDSCTFRKMSVPTNLHF